MDDIKNTLLNNNDTLANDILVSEVDLQPLLSCATLSEMEVAFNDMVTFKKKENYVLKVHKNKITRRNDSRHSKDFCYTRIKTAQGSKKVSGCYPDLIELLYNHYNRDKLENPSFRDIRKDFEEWFKVGRKPATVKVSDQAYKHIQGTALDTTPVCEISYQTIKKFFMELSANNAGKYTRSFYEKIRTDIYAMLEYALDNGIIDQKVPTYSFNKTMCVRFKQSDPRQTWTVSEHEKLIRYLESQNDPYALLFNYQLLTGDRFETASAMLPEDVDENNQTVFIHLHQVTADKNSDTGFVIVEGTKGNGSNGKRYVPLLPETLSVIKRAMELNPNGKYVFEANGRPLHPYTYRKRVIKICEEAGVPYHNPHSCRSYVASAMNTGGNIGEMCDYFGWSSKNMPLHYGRNINDTDSQIRLNLAKIAHRTT